MKNVELFDIYGLFIQKNYHLLNQPDTWFHLCNSLRQHIWHYLHHSPVSIYSTLCHRREHKRRELFSVLSMSVEQFHVVIAPNRKSHSNYLQNQYKCLLSFSSRFLHKLKLLWILFTAGTFFIFQTMIWITIKTTAVWYIINLYQLDIYFVNWFNFFALLSSYELLSSTGNTWMDVACWLWCDINYYWYEKFQIQAKLRHLSFTFHTTHASHKRTYQQNGMEMQTYVSVLNAKIIAHHGFRACLCLSLSHSVCMFFLID